MSTNVSNHCKVDGCTFNTASYPYVKHLDDGSHACLLATIPGGGRVQLYQPGEIWGAWCELDYPEFQDAMTAAMNAVVGIMPSGWVRKRTLEEGRELVERRT